jgi:PTS system nitrogen regulatory IIA component
MVNLSDFINPAAVKAELEATNKADVLEELSGLLLAAHPALAQLLTGAEVHRMLLEREQLAATGVGKGVAIPHAASQRLTRLYGGFARSGRGIDFGSIDAQPCHLFFVLLCPSAQPKVRIKALSRISRLLGDDAVRQALRTAPTAADIHRVLVEDDASGDLVAPATKSS